MSVLVIGAGLIGTSIGLALTAAGETVLLEDAAPGRAALAADLGAGRVRRVGEGADTAVLAVPPAAVALTLLRVQTERLAATSSDTASVKRAVLAAARQAGCDLATHVGGHPVAGRERHGPAAALADLFTGRSWILTPTAETSPGALDGARAIVRHCGATPVVMSPAAHDDALALVSHAPQLLASVLAGLLVGADGPTVALAGQGLRDTTRIAASDPELWSDIAQANADALAPLLDRVAASLGDAAHALRTGDAERVYQLLATGRAGRARLPGKHSTRAAAYASVPVVVPDEPGQIARVLTDAAAAGINVEDLTIEHSPGAPVGVIELAVLPAYADRLTTALRQAGWSVHAPA